jgi:hypothetical protein
MQVNELSQGKKTVEAENAVLNQKLSASSIPEPRDSLRRRTLRLANDIEAFESIENEKQQEYMQAHNGEPNAANHYASEHEARFVSSGLKERAVATIKELEGKGLPMGFLQYVSQNGDIGLDLEHLRDLAYRLNGDDTLERF